MRNVGGNSGNQTAHATQGHRLPRHFDDRDGGQDMHKIDMTRGRGRLDDSSLTTAGTTAVIRINNPAPPGVRVCVKAQILIPAASARGRLGNNIIKTTERAGGFRPGLIEVGATSGNTGIGLGMACAPKGYLRVLRMAGASRATDDS